MKKCLDHLLTTLVLLGLLSIPTFLSWLLGVQMAYEADPNNTTSWDGFKTAVVETRAGMPYIFGGLLTIFVFVFGGLFILQPVLMAPPEKK